jgi:uncharacterized protein (TIGR02452 family)
MEESKRELNCRVMTDTEQHYQNDPDLIEAVESSISREKIYWGNASIVSKGHPNKQTSPKISVLSCDTLTAAAQYQGAKVAILDFANNRHAGGSPFTAGAQEECLCRSTTLLPCLNAKQNDYYAKHSLDFQRGQLTRLGNDDAIYIPDVVVFKSSDSEPKLFNQNQRFKVNVIVMAAPQLDEDSSVDEKALYSALYRRIERIFAIAEAEGNRVLVLGAFGCGAFHNPPEMVAKIMKEFVNQYDFDAIDFAIKSWREDDPNLVVFKRIIEGKSSC